MAYIKKKALKIESEGGENLGTLEKWAEKQGVDNVKLKLMEEISELSTCVLQHVNKGSNNRQDIVTEVCDVDIMLGQYASLVNLTGDDLVEVVKQYYTGSNQVGISNTEKLIKAVLKLSTCISYLALHDLDRFDMLELVLAVDTIIDVFKLTKEELKERRGKVLCKIKGML